MQRPHRPAQQERTARLGAAIALAGLIAMTGCGPSPHDPVAPPQLVSPSNITTHSPNMVGERTLQPPTLISAPASGDVAAHLKAVREAADAAGERLVVYVGAKWCKPCKHFKAALKSGKLNDRGLAGLRFVEFDHDRDVRRLNAAGYRSRYIPAFTLAGGDGRATERKFTGASKGPGAVDTIVTRLGALLTPTE